MYKHSRTELLMAFQRDASGAWVCTRPIELQVPLGSLQVSPGMRFTKGIVHFGIDIATWLEWRLFGEGTKYFPDQSK